MLIFLSRLIARLPLGLLRALGAALGVLIWLLSPGYRAKMAAQIAQAGLPAALQRRAAADTGRGFLESLWVWFHGNEDLMARTDAAALKAVVQATPQGRILLTPHLGAWELAGRICGVLDPITVLYKPPRHPALHDWIRHARAHPGLTAVPADSSGVRTVLKALREGRCVGILPDQVPTDGEGEWAPFFGRAACTMTLPGRLAERTGRPVYILVAWRVRGGWRVEIERVLPDARPGSVNAAIEQLVRRAPEQYLWGYNRYKGQPPGAAS